MSKIVEKIKKLMALSSSDNENEAAVALKNARRLMDEHGVTDADLVISKIKESKSYACRGKQPHYYLVMLGEAISNLFDCKFYNSSYWSYEKKGWMIDFVFVGFNPNEEIAKYCFDVLSLKLVKARKNYLKKISKTVSNRPSKADSYANGWSYAVLIKVKPFVPKREIRLSNNKSIIPLDMIDNYINHKVSGKIRSKSRSTNKDDLVNGYKDGSEVEINKGMDYREKSLIN